VGADGPTHQGAFDISFMRCIPNMIIMVPSNEDECRQMLYSGYQYKGPAAVRYPRGTGTGITAQQQMQLIPLGKGKVLRRGEHIAILAFGPLLSACQHSADKLNATLVDMRFVKPLDEALLTELAASHRCFVTVEDNAVMAGAGSAVNEFIAQAQLNIQTVNLGLPDQFIKHGTQQEIYTELGLDSDGIFKRISALT
ncbi:MAG TPA: transketolase C-terminal domain-containing protein, partial [Rheinheimera sp.]|nr:transketolase C-terminal domain-containing protein [Rheinheimera sp.]